MDECGGYRPKEDKAMRDVNEESAMKAMGTPEEIKALKRRADRMFHLSSVEQEIFDTAEASGWHEHDRELPEALALIHSEVSEALEAYRDGMEETANQYRYKTTDVVVDPSDEYGEYVYMTLPKMPHIHDGTPVLGKPEGVASELADVIIRVLDYSRQKNIQTIPVMLQKMEFNKTRGYRHGNKRV